jgi:NTP pyrophosphatase (non-canonical NTP hydrolase)
MRIGSIYYSEIEMSLELAAQYNKLSAAETERLAILSEELGEVIQVVGKILRHGWLDAGYDNRAELEKELGDVYVAMRLLYDGGDVNPHKVHVSQIRKVDKIKKYLHHNELK